MHKHHEETFQKLNSKYVSIAHKFFCDCRDIALTVRDRVFEEREKQLIDMHGCEDSSLVFNFL